MDTLQEEARLLLVDDQPANLDVLRRVLEKQGYRIMLAPSGQVALKSAARAQPDLVLLDVMMPEMDGYEVCRRLKADEATRDIPVIFITANDQSEGLIDGFDAGAVDYVAKPFREEEVLMRVQTHLHISTLRRKLEAERQTARELKMGLMPETAPRIDGFAVGEVDLDGRKLRLANGGCPYHYRAATGEVVELETQAYPLGVRPDSTPPIREIALEPGDRIVFCSAGIVETRDGASDQIFGSERLAAAVRRACAADLDAEALIDCVVAAVDDFAGDAPQGDDRTVVVLQVKE